MFFRVELVPFILLFSAPSLCGQPPPDENPSKDAQALSQFQQLAEDFKKWGDWEQNADMIGSLVERVWRENGWETESDQFAKQAVSEILRIPPWNFTGRVQKMGELVGARYHFTDDQRSRLESSFYTEAGWMLVKNFRSVWDTTSEMISTRASGRPFTPELVAKWTRESEALTTDAKERFERIAQSMAKTMTLEQRRLLERDMESYRRRSAFADQIRERWVRGEWRPEDWGLERDPIQAQWQPPIPSPTSQPAEASAGRRGPIRAVLDHDESTWERYVRDFILRYHLDDAQQAAAYSILREMESRARDYRSTHAGELSRTRRNEAATDSGLAPIRKMFEELKARVAAIPTAAQRAAAHRIPGAPK